MSVDQLIEHLQALARRGCGELPVKAWDPDSEEGGYFPVTGVLILDNEIQLCVDML